MKLNITNDPAKMKGLIEIIKAAARKDEAGTQAREAIANFSGPVITQVLQQYATHRAFYNKLTYNFGEVPTIPLDLFDGNEEGLFDIWASSIPGGLATNHTSGGDEFRMYSHGYDTALSMLRRNAEEGRFDILVKSLERVGQELMLKEKFQAWATMLTALGAARTGGMPHVISATTTNVFQHDDVNRLKTKVARLRNSWVGGTSTDSVGLGFTHLVVSPEIMQQVRAMAYQPVNTRAGSLTTSGATAIPLPDQIRMSIFSESGLANIPGIGNLIELKEFGVGQSYNAIFDRAYTNGAGEPTFNSANDELILAVDLSVNAGVQVSAVDNDRSSELTMEEDDQYTKRSGRIGWFGGTETGFAWMDNKALSGIIV